MSFRPSVPCRTVEGTANAFGLRVFPPGAPPVGIHSGCPATRSGRVYCSVSTEAPRYTCALNGNPERATTIVARDQFLVIAERIASRFVEGICQVTAPEKLWRAAESDDASSLAADMTVFDRPATTSFEALSRECE